MKRHGIALRAGPVRLQTSPLELSASDANFCGFFDLDELAGFDVVNVATDGDGGGDERVIAYTLDILVGDV